MIVKNESKIIERMLNSIYPFVDSLCICDTGSTDNTVELIHKFAEEKNITNYLVYTEPFQNFEYNRTHALHKCLELPTLPTYILLIDADMVLQFGKKLELEQLKQGLCVQTPQPDVYFINQGHDAFYYKNARMLRAALLLDEEKPSYMGVTHEYLNIPGNRIYVDILKDILFIIDIGDGGAKQDKFERDIRLLKGGLEKDPNNTRYMYYLANSYKDTGDWENARDMYEKCVKSNGWVEERWQAHYQLGKGHLAHGNRAEAVHNWLQGYQLLPNRLENVYELIKHYRETSQNVLAYTFYKIAANTESIKKPPIFLFLENDVYDYKIYYELSVFGYYYNPDKIDLAHHSSNVLKRVLVPENIHANMMQNYQFYTPRLHRWNAATEVHEQQNMALLKGFGDIKYTVNNAAMHSSSPSFVITPDAQLYVCVRKVSYTIKDDGSYECPGGVITKNHMVQFDASTKVWKYKCQSELNYNRAYDDFYVGIEDLKLFYNTSANKIQYIGTRPLPRSNGITIESGYIDKPVNRPPLGVYATSNSTLLSNPKTNSECEKNWVLFEDAAGKTKVVYDWNNQKGISIGDLAEETSYRILDQGISAAQRDFIQTHTIDAKNKLPRGVRGSTNGVRIGNEVWFICHIVSHESVRNYYHIFVVLDAATYNVKCVSDLFKMSESTIEYVIGLTYLEASDKFLVGYSTMDRTANYVMLEKSVLVDRLHITPCV
jgi:glycosyltransferase involved in cell wall biosynthesis